jgi:hypothetical protein
MKNSIRLLGLVCLVALGGCKSDPFTHTEPLSVEKPKEPEHIPAPVLDVPSVMEFVEGKPAEYPIRAVVYKGSPVVTVSDLPAGATFDANNLKLSWTPSFTAANDPKDPLVVSRSYPVTILLRSSENSKSGVTRTVAFLAKDTARPMTIKLDPPKDIQEGQNYQQRLVVTSEDFPQGPFMVTSENLPQGAHIKQELGIPNTFSVSYFPDFYAVTTSDLYQSQTHYKRLDNLVFQVKSPRSQGDVKTNWRILDARQIPRISGPSSVNQGLEMSIALTSEDLNGEESPRVTLVETPPFGIVKIETNTADGKPGVLNPVTATAIRWENIPSEKLGTTYPLKVKGCVKKYKNDYNKTVCATKTITVSFVGTPHAAPVIDRREWPAGLIRYWKAAQKTKIPLPIRDAESTASKPTVTILPQALQSEVSWANGYLSLTPSSVGVKSFAVVAKSMFGVVQVENFTFEVLPTTWNNALLLGDSLTDPEVSSTQQLLAGGVDVANPDLQALDERLLAMRNYLLMGTNLLENAHALARFEEAKVNVRTTWVSSPLLDNFRGQMVQILKDLGITLEGRYSTFPNPPPLNSIPLVREGGGFSAPKEKIFLSGKLTSESTSPMVISLSLNSRCKKLFSLNNGTANYLVAVSCPLPWGRKLIVAGFEWADMSDITQAKTWMEEAVNP